MYIYVYIYIYICIYICIYMQIIYQHADSVPHISAFPSRLNWRRLRPSRSALAYWNVFLRGMVCERILLSSLIVYMVCLVNS